MTAKPKPKRSRVPRTPAPPKDFCEFFAGVGLVREGLQASGWNCVYANDIDPHKEQGYRARFDAAAGDATAGGADDHFHRGDVWETAEVLRRIAGRPALATASFPCIDLSLAGNYQGFQGKHSSTFFAFADVLERMGRRRPPLVMLENVVGFLSSRGGGDFAAAAQRLAGLGYWLDLFVLDARHFTPQSRPRVFLVGMLDEKFLRASLAAAQKRFWNDEEPQPAPSPEAAALAEAVLQDAETPPASGAASSEPVPPRPAARRTAASPSTAESHLRPEAVQRFKRELKLPTGWMHVEVPPPPERTLTLAEVIDLDDAQEWWDEAQVLRHHAMMSDLHRAKVDELVAAGGTWVGAAFRRKRGKNLRAEVRFDGLAGCLRTPKGGSAKQIVAAVVRGKLRMRWMSPREYARLQGAPDFPLVGPKTRQWWAFADAVCVPAVAWMDRHVLTPLYQRVRARRGPPHG